MIPWIALTAVSLSLLLVAEHRDHAVGKILTKPVASIGFVGLGLHAGAMQSFVGHVMLVALLLCLLGDLLLIGKSRPMFLSGLVAFLLGHVGYVVAFWLLGVELPWLAGGALLVVLTGVPILRWLWPHVSGGMKGPVAAYVGVISVMVAMAMGAFGAGASWLVPVGALLFYVSDICVARNRFVAEGSINRFVGLPLYYGGQILLAASIASM